MRYCGTLDKMLAGEFGRSDALPPETVLGVYTLEATVGHGGFGIVYRARHSELGFLVAIKEYLPAELADRQGTTVRVRSEAWKDSFDDGMRRFLREARALVALNGTPNVVVCRDLFRGNGTAYLVMDYEDGLALSDLLRKREAAGAPFTERDVLAVVVPLVEGLARVHAAGVWHRDVKPANILIRRADEKPVLIDFGASKQTVASYTKSVAPYTAGYAAPEQVGVEGELGPWTDVYGVGAVMWRMVAGGNRPWEPPNPVRAESRVYGLLGSGDPQPSAREVGAGRFSVGLLVAIDRCLSIRVPDRVQDCNELLGLIGYERGFATSSRLPKQEVQTQRAKRVVRHDEGPHKGRSEADLPSEEGTERRPLKNDEKIPIPRWISAVVLLTVLFVSAMILLVLSELVSGEANSPLPASRDKLPRFLLEQQLQLPPPSPVIRNWDLEILIEPTVRVTPEISPPQVELNLFDEPFGPDGPPPWVPDTEGERDPETWIAHGPFPIGDGVTSPRLLYKVEPEYSEEAKEAKYQGTVMVAAEVWEDGFLHNIRILRSLGLGLDEKAVEAVKQWKFSPGEKDGKPVRVSVQIQVSFRLL